MQRLRVAIVGVGPKGLFALERLLAHAGDLALAVDLYEPHPVPGAGPVYDPGQPDYLRMNFAAEQVDLWGATGVVPADERRSFVAWRTTGTGERYPPRAEVGRYLADGLALLRRHAPPGVRVELRRSQVRAAEACGGGWRVTADDGTASDYDEVLVAVGHPATAAGRPTVALGHPATAAGRPTVALGHPATAAGRPTVAAGDPATAAGRPTVAAGHPATAAGRPTVALGHPAVAGRPAGGWEHAAPLVPAVFPVAHWLAATRVPAASRVALRGFALTFLDAALALTEGRGGAFESDDGHPYRLRYVPGTGDVAALVPFSRTGRPMLAKPEPRLAASIESLGAIQEAGRARILALPDGLSLRGELLAILASTAGACLLAASDHRAGAPSRRASTTARAWLETACDGTSPPAELPPTGEIERSLAIGAGLHAPDAQWALGHMWRSLYPAIVARLGASGLADGDWPAFRRLAAQLERVSFGPPPVNAAKLLALVDAGRVDLDHVDGGQIVTRGTVTSIRSARGERTVDVVVDAVLAPPGVATAGQDALGGPVAAGDGVLARLVADGHARVRPGRRGLDVAPDAGVIGRDGRRMPGLSVVGRATEDAVIGNDTLSRTLHPHADRWAAGVVARAVAAARVARAPASVP